MTGGEAHVIAITAIFVFLGLNTERRGQGIKPAEWPDTGEGFMGIAGACAEAAATVCAWYDEQTEEVRENYGGVFDCEVVGPLGAAMFHNIHMTSDQVRLFLTAALITDRLKK